MPERTALLARAPAGVAAGAVAAAFALPPSALTQGGVAAAGGAVLALALWHAAGAELIRRLRRRMAAPEEAGPAGTAAPYPEPAQTRV